MDKLNLNMMGESDLDDLDTDLDESDVDMDIDGFAGDGFL